MQGEKIGLRLMRGKVSLDVELLALFLQYVVTIVARRFKVKCTLPRFIYTSRFEHLNMPNYALNIKLQGIGEICMTNQFHVNEHARLMTKQFHVNEHVSLPNVF